MWTEYTPKDVARFWSKVDTSAGLFECWWWTAGPKGSNKHGQMAWGGQKQYAHRISYLLAYGECPDHLEVCHTCDHPKCVNPSHFFLGTQRDNALDMYQKGRDNHPQGEECGRAKLTNAQVVEIRQLYANGYRRPTAIAKQYGVSKRHILMIARGQTRKSG